MYIFMKLYFEMNHFYIFYIFELNPKEFIYSQLLKLFDTTLSCR
jgi:hypothetical protein